MFHKGVVRTNIPFFSDGLAFYKSLQICRKLQKLYKPPKNAGEQCFMHA